MDSFIFFLIMRYPARTKIIPIIKTGLFFSIIPYPTDEMPIMQRMEMSNFSFKGDNFISIDI